jgi:hypothetical protein
MYYLHVHRIVALLAFDLGFRGGNACDCAIPNLTFELELLLVSSNDKEFDSGIIYEFPSSVMLTPKGIRLQDDILAELGHEYVL